MGGYFLSPRAQKDLELIWDFSVQRWGEARTEDYLLAIRKGIELIARDPRHGRVCEVRADYFRYFVGRHVVFFKVRIDGIEVVRILHQSMDFGQHI